MTTMGVDFRIQVPSMFLSDVLCVQPSSDIVDSDMMTQDLFLKHVWGDSSIAERSTAGAFDVVTAEYDGDRDSDGAELHGWNVNSDLYDNDKNNEYENDHDDRNNDTNEERLGVEYSDRKNHITRRSTGRAGKHRKVFGSLPSFQVFSDLLRGAEISRDRSRYVPSSNLLPLINLNHHYFFHYFFHPIPSLSFHLIYFNNFFIAVK